MKHRLLFLAIGLAWISSCRIPYSASFLKNKNRGVRLAYVESEDGTRSEWRLYANNRKAPRIELTESTVDIVPNMGAKISAVTRERADSVGVLPWRGVWVETVDPAGAAHEAGLRAGDIILSLAGDSMNSAEQFTDTLTARWVPGEALELTARIQPRLNLDVQATEAELQVTPESAEVRSERTDSIELETSPGVQSYTGLQAVQVPTELAQAIFGLNRPAVLTSGVQPGSPAYKAGFRSGDHIQTCDGAPVRGLDDLRQAVGWRVRQRYPKRALKDLHSSQAADESRFNPRALTLSVQGPSGAHSADLAITDRLDHRSDIHVPILLDYNSSVERTDISFLDFIFQFGFNYTSHAWPTSSRSGLTTSSLSILPFGMFEVARSNASTRYRLFWFITWRSSRK